MKLSSFLEMGVVLPHLKGNSTEEVVGEMLDGLIELGRLDPPDRDQTLIALLKRESMETTGLGSGVAMPHAKLEYIPDFVGGLGLSRPGVDFRSSDRRPVHAVFLMLSPVDDPYGHLNLMGTIAGIVREEGAVDTLTRCHTAQACIDRIAELERSLFPED